MVLMIISILQLARLMTTRDSTAKRKKLRRRRSERPSRRKVEM
jgi:hypothetical protein